jgi:hypothetical protein
MPEVLAYVGGGAALIAAGVHVYNALRAERWKRTELGSRFLRELGTDQELVFACRALDWYTGRLTVPENLRPLMSGEAPFDHDRRVLRNAMKVGLGGAAMAADARLQIYRTTMDRLLSWMCLLANALDRKLFKTDDVEVARYWVSKVAASRFLHPFIRSYNYAPSIQSLAKSFGIEIDLSGKKRASPVATGSAAVVGPKVR